jgi:hypothetical protein
MFRLWNTGIYGSLAKLYKELLPKAGIECGSPADQLAGSCIALCCTLAGEATDVTVD